MGIDGRTLKHIMFNKPKISIEAELDSIGPGLAREDLDFGKIGSFIA